MTKCFQLFPVSVFTFLLLFHVGLHGQTNDPDKGIVSAITAGNASELADYFNTMVDISIPGKEDTYGKNQAMRIIQDFFRENPVKSFQINKQGNSSDGARFSIGRMESGKKVFRVYYLLKQTSGKYLIHQFQIQEEN